MNPGLLRGFPGDTKPRYIYAAEVLYDVTLGSNGAFDTNDVWPNGLPLGYERFEIEAHLRSAVSSNIDDPRIYFNGDNTGANYSVEWARFYSGATNFSRQDYPAFGRSTGATSPANVFTQVSSTIFSPQATSRRKSWLSSAATRYIESDNGFDMQAGDWESTAAITRVQIRTDNHPTDLFAAGSALRLIGYRNISISELMG